MPLATKIQLVKFGAGDEAKYLNPEHVTGVFPYPWNDGDGVVIHSQVQFVDGKYTIIDEKPSSVVQRLKGFGTA